MLQESISILATSCFCLLVALVAFELFCRALNRRGSDVSLLEIRYRLECALLWGRSGSGLILRHKPSRRWIELQIFPSSSGTARSRIILKRRCCPESDFLAVQNALRDAEIEFAVTPTGSDSRSQYIVAECGPGADNAARAVRVVFIEGFHLSYDVTLRSSTRGRFDCRLPLPPDGR